MKSILRVVKERLTCNTDLKLLDKTANCITSVPKILPPAQTKKLRTVLIVTIFLFFAGSSTNTFAQAWYNNSWGFRKSHVITGSSGAGTNYQVRIVAHKATATDVAADVYMGTSVRDDFGDVRFTASDGTTLLSYWMETGSLISGSQAAFWVKVAADLGTNQTIYTYYGNAAATTVGNGVNTFLLFDDFDGTTLDATKWTKRNANTPSFSAGLMTISANNVDPAKIIATGGPTANNNAIVARFQVTGGVNADERAGVGVRTTNTTNPQGFTYILHNFAALNETKFLDDGVTYGASNYGSWSKNTFYNMEVFHDGTNVRGRTNYGTWNAQAWTTRTGTTYLSLNPGSFDATTVWDWAFIRKCITTEPAQGAWGTVQTAPPGLTSFSPTSGCTGATGIIITGTNFTGATALNFNGVSAAYVVNSSTQITATVPLTVTTGTISVTTPGGSATSGTSFTVNPLPVSAVNGQANVTCFGETNGSITISASAGTGPYSYSVDNGSNWISSASNPYTYSGLVANQAYRIKVRDSKGCISK